MLIVDSRFIQAGCGEGDGKDPLQLDRSSQSFIASYPARVSEYPPSNFSLTNIFLSVRSLSVALSRLKLGPEKHNINPGVMRYWRKICNTRCSGFVSNRLSTATDRSF